MIRYISLFAALALMCTPVFAHAKDTAPHLPVQTISSNGIDAWLVEDHSLPIVTIKFAFVGGTIYDPDDKPGLAKLASVLLDEGAGDILSQDFQAQLSDNAIRLSFSPGRDAFIGTLQTPRTHKDQAFQLLSLALTKPRFDADAVARMKETLVADIKASMGDPAWLSARTFNGVVFENHFYGLPGGGTIEGLGRITPRDLRDFISNQFAQNLLRVVVVGDMTADETRTMLSTVFGNLPKTTDQPVGKPATLAHTGQTILLPFETPQTYIAIAQPSVARNSDEWYTAQVMAYILGGGGFNSRLMHEVREKRGLTYGVYSTLIALDYANVLQTTLSAGNDKVAEALSVIRQEFARMTKEPVRGDELAAAKSYLIGAMPLELTSTSDIADVLLSLRLDNLPPQELENRIARIRAVTAKDIQALAARLLDPAQTTTILVGKPDAVTTDVMLDQAPGLGALPAEDE